MRIDETKLAAMTREEQETAITIERSDTVAKIYTSDRTMITKLNRILEVEGTEARLTHVDDFGVTVELPKDLLRFAAKRRVMTDEQREEAAERLRSYREEEEEEEEG